jgi:hypothetical protein
MKVLVACEESQRVTIEFRKLGHEAYSCDLLDCSGNHPEWHIKKDVTLLLNGNCIFYTVDGLEHEISGKWDMIIAFPPCTYLTVACNRWFNCEKYGDKAIQRMLDRKNAIRFFMTIANADCDRIAIENPVGIMSTEWRKPEQIIQPFEFGDAYEKKTCLWLKGLKKLVPTDIAKAMATQWGRLEKRYYDYTSEDFINAGIAKECTDCPDFCEEDCIENAECARGNDVFEGCKTVKNQYCEQVHKQMKAKSNPEWHHVSLATLANIDIDMLDEKRQRYFKIYKELIKTVNDLHKCKTAATYATRWRRFKQVIADDIYYRGTTLYMIRFLDSKISMCNVECGLWSSADEKATSFIKSRRYRHTTLKE